MQVLHVAPTAFGVEGLFGGGERYPLELARALNDIDGIDCRLVTFGSRARAERDARGLPVRVLKPLLHLHRHPAHPIAPSLLAALGGADVVHAHHLRSAPARMAAVSATARRQAFVVTDHGLAGGDWRGLLPRMVDRFLTVSQFSADTLAAPPSKTRVIYGGADSDRFTPDVAVQRDGVLFVGRITPHKGLDVLLRALPERASLTVVGTTGHDREPPERDYPAFVRSLASGRDVRFPGSIDDDDLAVAYRRAAVLAAPSVTTTCYGRRVEISELLGLSVLEAMASGTPVVASRVGGLAEIVEDGKTGYLVEPGDVLALGDRLEELLGDRALARTMGDNARDRILASYTWAACARRCVAAYRELLT
jgi:glycosyltransferase involved in cell wall biosynthesis